LLSSLGLIDGRFLDDIRLLDNFGLFGRLGLLNNFGFLNDTENITSLWLVSLDLLDAGFEILRWLGFFGQLGLFDNWSRNLNFWFFLYDSRQLWFDYRLH
jgi:hypothetical protein